MQGRNPAMHDQTDGEATNVHLRKSLAADVAAFLRRGGTVRRERGFAGAPIAGKAGAECSVDGCGVSRNLTRGMCSKHYQRWRNHGDTDALRVASLAGVECSVDGCDRAARSKGLCNRHYEAARGRGECSEDGCNRTAKTRGMCSKHYQRWLAAQRRG